MKIELNDDVYTRSEAAEILGIHPSRVSRLFDAGVLKGYRIGEGYRCSLFITKESVKQRLENPGHAGIRINKKSKGA